MILKIAASDLQKKTWYHGNVLMSKPDAAIHAIVNFENKIAATGCEIIDSPAKSIGFPFVITVRCDERAKEKLLATGAVVIVEEIEDCTPVAADVH